MNTDGRIVVEGTRAIFETAYAEELPTKHMDSAALRRIADALIKFADNIDHINVALNPVAKSAIASHPDAMLKDGYDDIPF